MPHNRLSVLLGEIAVAKIIKYRLDWNNNDGRCFPAPGMVKKVKCGICGRQMKVKRNVLGPTSWVESMARGKHLHDSFMCPNLNQDWHKKIVDLKIEEHNTASDKIKKILEKEILEILKVHAVR